MWDSHRSYHSCHPELKSDSLNIRQRFGNNRSLAATWWSFLELSLGDHGKPCSSLKHSTSFICVLLQL